ncbi:MAG: FAD-dependent oxidoreductase [Proteobacteria bacterium]|nr:FAD-dependent oxidoreductase [Pseudomonadota bacterium]
MVKGPDKIKNGSKVAVIGGGPAGSFFALYLLRYAGETQIRPEITIYQQRNFDELGPKGCKGCAGILSISFLRNFAELNLSIPEEIIQNEITDYAVHSPYTSISISNPEKGIQIASIYRGGGAHPSHYENSISFDGWLLNQALRQGAKVENRRVSGIYLGQEVGIKVRGKKLKYDLVVLASGVNASPVQVLGLDYAPPQTKRMAMGELYAGTAQVQSRLGNVAHVFLIPHSGLIFGTLVPKGPFINVSVLSSSEHPVPVTDFLSHDIVRDILPDSYKHVCGCQPLAAISSAHNYYADRFIAVGDAAVSRLYKDGIGSSLLTAREAARTIIYHGLSRHDFERHYQPLCSDIDRDNWWGRLLFWINDKAKDSRAFLLAQHRLVGNEQDNLKGPQPFTKAAWGMFSGSYSYGSIARRVFGPASLVKLLWLLLKESFGRLYSKGVVYPKRLHVGSRKVLILGSGFGGTYVLRNLVPSLNQNENVETTMVSDENFFLFAPLLHHVAMGGIETRHIAYPIRRLHWRDRFNFVQGCVERIDLRGRNVITTIGALDFDYLVLALGSVPDMSELNSLESNVFTLKTLHDSMLIRNHVIGVFEQAIIERDPERQRQLLTFVVSGAGYIGVQLVTELRDFIFRNLIRFYKAIDPGNIRIILVEAEPKIVAELHTKLGAYAMRHLQRMGIEVRLRSRVTRVWEDHVEINGTEFIPTNTLIWVAGVLANPRIAELNVEKDSIGRVLVNEYLEIPRVPGVYAVGDCVHFEDPKSGMPVPLRAYVAVREAKIVAHNILADIRGKNKKPYRYSGTPEIVSLGASKAVLRFHGLRLYGFPARLIWLGVYSSLVTGTYNRVRVLTDWLLSLLFGRDITFLKLMK